MAEVGGMLAYAMLKVVTQQIGSIIGGQLKLQWDFSDDLRKMKMTLDSMEAVLQDAERRSIQDAAVRLWLKRLTDAMYGISDILGEFETTAEPPGWKVCMLYFTMFHSDCYFRMFVTDCIPLKHFYIGVTTKTISMYYQQW
jgi:hypothetical protein